MTFFMLHTDNRKKRFVGLRMEEDLFKALSEEANKRDIDVSSCIREICTSVLR